MFCLRARYALLASVIVAATSVPARAGNCCNAPAPCAPTYRTVKCIEYVPEKYTTERTVYKTEYRQEEYEAWKCETFPVTKTRNVTCYTMVPEEKIISRMVCKTIQVEEERTIMETHYSCKPVMKTVKKCVEKGHWECQTVECKPSCFERLCHKKDDCCCEAPKKYKTKKVWVSCPVYCEEQVCVMEKVKECRPVKVKCTVCKTIQVEEKVKVCCHKCVATTKTKACTYFKTRKVPYKATRCVAHCVPVKETVTCCRMVAKCTEKQVACEPECCEPKCKARKCGGLFSKKSCGEKSCCE